MPSNPVGRLITLRPETPRTLDDVAILGRRLGELLSQCTVPKLLFVTDLSTWDVVSPTISTRCAAILRADNPRVEHNAIVLGPSASAGLQMARWIREAGHPGRRAFRSPRRAAAWLAERCAPPEAEAARRFLGVAARRPSVAPRG
ncbi:MAG TPA: hypothetical protein RMH99_15530 [Sandaracinaceae bacterium LLY-WYZ-13_1]|nr:hypothetical protein [Sandaracinaceae bacterium LLY-WYZ-13_1]